jgi:hypothetical protein
MTRHQWQDAYPTGINSGTPRSLASDITSASPFAVPGRPATGCGTPRTGTVALAVNEPVQVR